MTFLHVLRQLGLRTDQLQVWVFAPYIQTPQGLFSEHYDKPVTRAELGEAFASLGLNWRWQPITMENKNAVIAGIRSGNGQHIPVILNFCDGDEIHGYPGISVVRLLEENELIFTGADSFFYDLTTSKIPMKKAMAAAGVPTAPFAIIEDPARDCYGVCARLGTPLLVKPAISAGSYGLSLRSVVFNDDDLREQAERVLHGLHGCDFSEGGVFVERYISGPEFTVLVVGSPNHPSARRAYPPLERAFNLHLPEEERFFSFERYWEFYEEETPPPQGERLYEVRLAESSLWQRLSEVSWQAFSSVGGTGYARVDLRLDYRTNELFVLEVNSNCGISSPADDSSVGRILEHADLPFDQLIGEILADGLLRYAEKYRTTVIRT